MPITSFADEVAQSYSLDLEQAEELLRDIASKNRKPTPAEYAFFIRCGWSHTQINDQHRRASQAMNLAAVAGSPETREAALVESETASSLLESEGPKIREKLDKLQKQLDGLERDKRLSQKRCEEQSQAVVQLRELVPAYIRQQVDATLCALNTSGVGATLREATARRHELVCILNHGAVYDSPAKHLEFGLRRMLPEAVLTIVEGRSNRYVLSDQWPALNAVAAREFAEVSQRLPELQREYDSALAVVESPLDFYADPKNWELG